MLFGRMLKTAAVTRFLVVLVAVLACSFQLLDLKDVDQFFNFHIAHNFLDKLLTHPRGAKRSPLHRNLPHISYKDETWQLYLTEEDPKNI